jgi:D-alanine-D-alanine ligase
MSSIQAVSESPTEQLQNPGAKVTGKSLAVTVLLGGPSSEREISIKSGKAVAETLEQVGHEVVRADISPTDLTAFDREKLGVIFPALHGAFGEDGGVQEIMEGRGIRYCGSGPQASRLAMEKMFSKWRFLQAGLPVPDGGLIDRDSSSEVRERLIERLGLPLVAKPVDQGSSLEVHIAHDQEARSRVIDRLLDEYGRCLLERFIPGREITVGILGEEALPVVEIVTPDGLFDFQSKYESQATEYLLEVDMPTETYKHLQWIGLQAHKVLGCRDFSRVDMRLDPAGRPAVLEVNTIPGFTSRSLLPMAAAKAGIDFPHLCDRLVRMAAQRPGDRHQKG